MADIDYKIAIPSYKRSDTINDHTLRVLREADIPMEKVHIFCADKKQSNLYRTKVSPAVHVHSGIRGMGAIRRFIQNFFDAGDFILNLDDDIRELSYLSNNSLKPVGNNLEKIIENGFKLCIKHKTKLWGIYPVYNAFFMRNKIDIGYYYIEGAFFGTINDKDPALSVTLDDKEDFERSIKNYIKFGKVIRLRFITMKTNYYTEPGGMQEDRTEERVTKSAQYLVNKYPGLCEFNTARKRHTEIRLKDRRGG